MHLQFFWKKLQVWDQSTKPCPFGSGLRKFALDPVIAIFFKNEKKKYKWRSDPVLRKFCLDPIVQLFAKIIYVVKNCQFYLVKRRLRGGRGPKIADFETT